MSSVGPPRAPVHVISSKNLEYSGIGNHFHFLEDEMATSSHIHEVLISITSPTHQSPLIGLHHWSPRQIHSSYLSPLTVKPEYLRGYEGFQELGSFCLPKECASSMVTVHAYLSCLIPKYGEDIVAPSTESEITASITAGLGAKTWPASSTVTIQLFKMLVRGNSQEELFTGGEVAIWKSVWPKRN